MIRVYKAESGHLVQLEGLSEIGEADCAWIDMLSPTLEEDHMVEDFLKISIPTKEDMEEIESSARLYDESGAGYMTMSSVAQIHVDDPVKAPLTFIVHGKVLVTVRYEELLSFSQYVTEARKKNGVSLPTPEGLMLDIVESIINRVADSLEMLSSEVDAISRGIFRNKKKSVQRNTNGLQVSIRKIGEKGDLLGMLRESLSSISRLLYHFDARAGQPDSKPLRAKMKSLYRDVDTLVDHANFLSGKMNFLLDATLGLINLEQNQIIKIFSVAAVAFLPPTLVATIYGMNFHVMPELDWRFGYPLALCVMLISAIVPLLYFKKRGWL